jgi:hypothetical protein
MITKVRIAPRIAGGLDFRDHLRGRNHALAGEMAAALGPALVFDMHAGDAGFFIIADRAARVDRVAVAGVGIGDNGQLARIDDAARVVDHFGRGQQSDVGMPRPRDAGAEARHVHGVESRQLDEPCGEPVGDTGSDYAAGAGQQFT